MSQEMRIVKLPIFNPIHRNFLYGQFRQDLESPIVLDRNQDLGSYISSWIRYADTPKIHDNETCIDVVAPIRVTRSADKHFLNFTKEDVQKINDHIKAIYELDRERFFYSGLKQEYLQKDIIEAYIISRNLTPFFNGDIETIKKREYREEVNLLKKMANKMRMQAYRKSKRIDSMVSDAVNSLLVN
jgi:hypothetical protein